MLNITKPKKTKTKNGTKARMIYHLTSVTMAIIKKPIDNKCWQGCGEIEILIYPWATIENSLKVPQKVKQRSIQSSNSTPKYLSQRIENRCSNKNFCINIFNSTIHNSQKVETTLVSIDWWIFMEKCGITIR